MTKPRASLSRSLLACALLMEAAFALIHLARTPLQQITLVLVSYLISGGAYGWLLWRLRNERAGSASRSTIVILIAVGVAFRITLLPLVPATSQDVQRYLWEGQVQRYGANPYVYAPTASALAPLAAEHHSVWRLINHPNVPAIYPPFAQMLFYFNAVAFGGPLLGWKLILLAFDGLLVGGLWVFLRQRSEAIAGLAGVLWCPLLLLETYEGGHLDLIGAALLVLAIVMLIRGQTIPAAVALGLCINVKYLWPLMILIIMARHAAQHRRGVVFVVITGLVATACWLPYRGGIAAGAETARMFAEEWTFNDLVFELLREVPGPRLVPMALVLAILVGLAALLAFRERRDIWSDSWLLGGTALLLGPVAYPWYFIWIVPALALSPPLWLIVWTVTVPALHLVDWHYVSSGEWNEMRWLWVIIGVVPAFLLIRAWHKRLSAGEKGMLEATSNSKNAVDL